MEVISDSNAQENLAINFEVDLRKRTHLFSLDSELATRLTEIAKSRKISSQSILNNWLKEKILQQA